MLCQTFASVICLATTLAAASGPHGHEQHGHHHKRANETSDYEYVVVGSGPGGGPLAARLAIAGHKVLLIEAGPDPGDAVNQTVPARNLQSTEDPLIKWDYFVTHYKDQERQARDSKMTYRRVDGGYYTGKYPPAGAEPLGILYPRAGALGGCAEHNAAVTIYPFESDWTYHQNLTGDVSWAPANMRSYFKKLERAQYLTGGGHGYNGWFRSSLTELTLVLADFKLLSVVISAASALGKSDLLTTVINTVTGLANILVTDINAEYEGRDQKQDLFQIPQAVDRETSKRSTPRDFILETANAVNADESHRYHLDLKLNTLATKIRFDRSGSTPKAVGVEYLSGEYLYRASPNIPVDNGTAGYVAASKEVIISTGTFNTPQLLKLSGIGPRDELEQVGIDVVKDLPGVGQNMQDRYEVSIVSQTDEKLLISKNCNFGYEGNTDPCLEQWKTGKTAIDRGPYGTGGVAVGVTKKSSAASESEDPDLIIIGAPGRFAGYYPGFAYDSTHPSNIWSWLALKAHTHNHAGTVTLRSADPRDVPQIDFSSLDTGSDGHEKDLQALYEGLLFGREAFDKLIPLDGNFTEIMPGRNVTGEAGLKQFIQDETWGHHACCTAPIDADNDPNAVLDSRFRVRGVKNLRVVDASSFAKIPGTFIAVPIYIISEKAADDIINDR